MKRKTIVFLVICLLLALAAAIPRSIEVLSGNFVFGYDQGKHWLAAGDIATGQKFPLIGDEVGGRGGFFQGSGWFYLLAVPYFLFGGNPYGAVLLMFTLGIGMVLLMVKLMAGPLGKKDALLVAVMLAMAPILISSSRFAWPPFVVPFLTVIYLWSVWGILKKRYAFVGVAFFSVGMMAHFEIASSGTLFIASLLMFTVFSVFRRINIKYLGLAVASYLLPLAGLAVFDLRHDFLNFRGILSTLQGVKRPVNTWDDYWIIVLNHWMIFSDEFIRAFQMEFLPKVVLVGYMIAGIIVLLRDKSLALIRRQYVAFLALLPIVLFSVFLLYRNDLWAWWITELNVVYPMLFALVSSYIWGKKGIIGKIVVSGILILMVASFSVRSVNSLIREIPDYGGVHKVKGKTDALDAIFADAAGERFGIMVFTPPIYTYAYDFLIPWYGTRRYGFAPQSRKESLLYLLIEPDLGEPWRHKGWLETVIKDGTVEKTWTLPSGFIIEKRRMPQ